MICLGTTKKHLTQNVVEKDVESVENQFRLCQELFFFSRSTEFVVAQEARCPLLLAAARTRAVPIVHKVPIHVHLVRQGSRVPAGGAKHDIFEHTGTILLSHSLHHLFPRQTILRISIRCGNGDYGHLRRASTRTGLPSKRGASP